MGEDQNAEKKDEGRVVLILERRGLADMKPVARWENGTWTEVPEEPHAFDEYYEDVSEEILFNDFDGPDFFAIHEEDFQSGGNEKDESGGQVTLGDLDGQSSSPTERTEGEENAPTAEAMPLQERIIRLLRPRTDEILSSAWIEDQIDAPDDEVTKAAQELIEWGELELIATTGIAGRVQVKESATKDEPSVWMVYIASGYKERRATRLFSTKSSAFSHLREIIGSHIGNLERVDYLNGVWTAPTGNSIGYLSDTAVMRRERIYDPVRQ